MSNPVEIWYPFYPSDYRRSTRFISDDADLLYRRMLDLYWESDGDLPANNLKSIAKHTGYQWRKFARCFEEISDKFPEVSGKLTNARMDIEIEKAKKNHEVAVKNGKKGGRPKQNLQVVSSLSQKKALNGDGDGPYQGSEDNHQESNKRKSTSSAEINPEDF